MTMTRTLRLRWTRSLRLERSNWMCTKYLKITNLYFNCFLNFEPILIPTVFTNLNEIQEQVFN